MNIAPFISPMLGLLPKLLDLLSANLYKRFFHKSNAMFMVASQEGRIIEINDGFAKALGYRREDLRGTYFMRLVHPDDHTKTTEAMSELEIGADISWSFQNRYRAANGAYKALLWVATKNGAKEIYATARIVDENLV